MQRCTHTHAHTHTHTLVWRSVCAALACWDVFPPLKECHTLTHTHPCPLTPPHLQGPPSSTHTHTYSHTHTHSHTLSPYCMTRTVTSPRLITALLVETASTNLSSCQATDNIVYIFHSTLPMMISDELCHFLFLSIQPFVRRHP